MMSAAAFQKGIWQKTCARMVIPSQVVHKDNSVHSLAVAKRTLKASEEAQADVDARVLKWLESFVKNPTAKRQ
jgi:hypothetical protein